MIPASGRPRVFTIPASVDFLPALARALMAGDLIPGFAPRDPLELAKATIYLPTRRACRLAAEAFLAAMPADAVILPRIVPIGDIDEEEFVFADITGTGGILDLPDAIGGLERRAMLAQLILRWAVSGDLRTGEGAPLVAQSPAAALALADDLARLMDDMTTRQVQWDKLDTLVPEDFDKYWQSALEFLKIARETWPAIREEHGTIEPAARRDRLIEEEAKRLATSHKGPVIIAGSTGSMPSTAKLIETISKLPHGVAVLPGLDKLLDDESWRTLAGDEKAKTMPAFGHPQFAMQALLNRLQITRDDVVVIGGSPHGRDLLVSEALRPADTTDLWQRHLAQPAVAAQISAAVDNMTLIEAANADEEALAIAVALREVLETPGKTAALVTPDRALARRVLAALGRWNVVADDSGGDPLTATQAGVFARLAAEVALEGTAPVPLLALLKHPLLRLGKPDGAWTVAVAALERAVLRGARPRAGTMALSATLMRFRKEWDALKGGEKSSLHHNDPRANLSADELDAAARLAEALSAALAPLESLAGQRGQPLGDIAAAHLAALQNLSTDTDGNTCFAGDDGTALARLFDEIATIRAAANIAIGAADYPEIFDAAAASYIVRRPGNPGARVRIYGLLEARLTHADRVVLGGLVEGAWPPQTRNDPWLSRPMRHQLGLDLPERRIGLAAHDFAQLLGAPEVVLTRAAKMSGAPTIASRFVQRLAAVAGNTWKKVEARGHEYLAMARDLDDPRAAPKPVACPDPRPPRDKRPMALSVTEIETWLRDPYSIYARHVLKLRPLEPVDNPPGARDRGTLIHGAIADFAKDCRDALPADIATKLIEFGETRFAPLKDFPEARAFWWPRFLRIADWFVEFETQRRANAGKVDAEISGSHEIPIGNRIFKLRARADRIEHLSDGRFALLDYKTGTPPTPPQVRSGLAPQMTLEGAILQKGGFKDIPAGSALAAFIYVRLHGGDPPGLLKPIAWNDTTPEEQADNALRKLTELVTKFDDDKQAYLSRVSPMFFRRQPGDYDHLSRVKEWSLAGGGDEEDAE